MVTFFVPLFHFLQCPLWPFQREERLPVLTGDCAGRRRRENGVAGCAAGAAWALFYFLALSHPHTVSFFPHTQRDPSASLLSIHFLPYLGCYCLTLLSNQLPHVAMDCACGELGRCWCWPNQKAMTGQGGSEGMLCWDPPVVHSLRSTVLPHNYCS